MTDELKKETNPDKPLWRDRLEKKREEVKKKSAQIIDDSFDEAVSIIHKLLKSQRERPADMWGDVATGIAAIYVKVWKALLAVVFAAA